MQLYSTGVHRIEDRALVANSAGLSFMCFFTIAVESRVVSGLDLMSRGGCRGRGISIILIG